MTDAELKDPDVFSSELHYALLNEGLKGPTLRRLHRISRGEAELGRILETKISELRHYLRSSRTPTLANLPVRMWERVSDNARFTPPKEVFLTLVYVGVVMVGIDFFKNHVMTPTPSNDFPIGPAANLDFTSPRLATSRSTTSDMQLIDQWMVDEVKHASQSPAWRETIKKEVAASVDSVDFEALLSKKIETALQSPRITNRLNDLTRDKAVISDALDLSTRMSAAAVLLTARVTTVASSLAAVADAARAQLPISPDPTTATAAADASGGHASP